MIKLIEVDEETDKEDLRFFAYLDMIKNEFFGWEGEYTWTTFKKFAESYEKHKANGEKFSYPLSVFRNITPDYEE